ncbi:AAA family ATPase [Candidatus Methylobacter oryzae]|uniref:AAA family ATPase n=1 Tax=Candidatus Methylobacter oryzae TaxID=2497749 RepID=A0ABY3CET5_9GAMM|nr:ATP-binding protein [Candidatus Methylobacter oryzae]TRX00707.1 AAA family ATPase [Candidatus Methylobacter oryzae]
MIRKLHINNYKSLHDLTLDVGRFNVLIGENGCGKSNLLEAIGLVAAAAADKLDNEFLVSRGIRVTEPQLMRSAFSEDNLQEPIKIGVGFENIGRLLKYTLNHEDEAYAKWTRLEAELSDLIMRWKILKEMEEDPSKNSKKSLPHQMLAITPTTWGFIKMSIVHSAAKFFEGNEDEAKNYLEHYKEVLNSESKFESFIIYSPENTALRNFYKEGQIEPLGINGEGLLKLLKVIQSKSPEQRQDIHASLQLFDWYAELDIPKDLSSIEDKVTITDRYLTQVFDQRSANEGFLFVLFYIALMVSDDTPKIFAIDNIDTSLNPKLCTKLIKELTRLAKKYDKQVFVTTHNPAILDGIDLGDDEQRLLVLSRNKQGHTRYKRITLEDKPRSSTNEDLKLSEAFLRGYLGGLPKGF